MAPISEYINVLVYLAVALAIGVLAVVVGAVLGPKRPSRAKLMAYESGNDPPGRSSASRCISMRWPCSSSSSTWR